MDGGSVSTETAEGLFFTEEKLWLPCAKCIDKRDVVALPRFDEEVGTNQRGDKTDDVQLLRFSAGAE